MPEQNHQTESAGERSATPISQGWLVQIEAGDITVTDRHQIVAWLRELTAARQRIEGLEAELVTTNDVLQSYRGTYTREKERAESAESRLAAVEAVLAQIKSGKACCDYGNYLEAERDAIRLATIEECAKERDAVPILPGDMPDEMWDAIKGDRDAYSESLRIVIRQTLDEYEQGDANGGWISVADRAPDDMRVVEVTDGDDRCYGTCCKGHLWNFEDGWTGGPATYWRELPPLPAASGMDEGAHGNKG